MEFIAKKNNDEMVAIKFNITGYWLENGYITTIPDYDVAYEISMDDQFLRKNLERDEYIYDYDELMDAINHWKDCAENDSPEIMGYTSPINEEPWFEVKLAEEKYEDEDEI